LKKEIQMKKLTNYLFLISFFVCFSANAQWQRKFSKDDFTDVETVSYSVGALKGTANGMFLLLFCKKSGVGVNWQISFNDTSKAPFGGMPLEVNVRVDTNDIYKEEWTWSGASPMIIPNNEQQKTLLKGLIGSKKLALKTTFPEAISTFDMSGYDQALTEMTTKCK
jgi:hypothetical protein